MKGSAGLYPIMIVLAFFSAMLIYAEENADLEPPEIAYFSIPEKTINPEIFPNLDATDNVGITGWLINQVSDIPAVDSPQWSPEYPYSYKLGEKTGTYILYAWAKDAAGNISSPRIASTDYIIDKDPPVITTFYLPEETVAADIYVSLEGTDDMGIIGWIMRENKAPPAADDPDWVTDAPYNYTLKKTGLHKLYAWAKDEAGNVSNTAVAGTIYVFDNESPIISNFTVPFETTNAEVPVILEGYDDKGIMGWMISNSDDQPAINHPEWNSNTPYNYVLEGEFGTYILYAWAKDAAGNISQPISAVINYYSETQELSYGN